MINSDMMSKFILQGVAYEKEINDRTTGGSRRYNSVSCIVLPGQNV